MKKKMLILVLAMVMAISCFGVVGCKKNDDSVLTIFRWDFAQVDSARKKKSPIYKKIYEKIGVDIKAETCGSSSWEGVLNNKYNTGDLPDVFVSYGMDRPIVYEKWIRDKAILPISDYVSETKFVNIFNKLNEFSFLQERLPYANGKHYSLPISTSLEHGMYIRLDWINNLNETAKLTTILTDELGHAPSAAELESGKFVAPKTLLEFYRLARAFSKYDPDNNGRADTFGYTSSEKNMWFNNWIFEAFGSTFFGMVEDGNGGLTASWLDEANKKSVAFLNRLYSEGIMDPDYISITADQKNKAFVTGKVGMMVGNIWYNTILSQFKSANGVSDEAAKAAFTIIPPPAGEDGSYGMRGNAGFWCTTSLSTNMSAAKRDKALTLLDYLLSPEGVELFTYGIEGVNYKVENGEKVSLMGTDSAGLNYTVESSDPAFALSSLTSWSLSYYMPFQTNGELIQGFMNAAKEYSRVDPVVYVQTPLYVQRDQTLGSNAIDKFVEMIASSANTPAYDKQGLPKWDNLISFNNNYNDKWNSFKNEYNNMWGGAAMISEYSAAASKYLKK